MPCVCFAVVSFHRPLHNCFTALLPFSRRLRVHALTCRHPAVVPVPPSSPLRAFMSVVALHCLLCCCVCADMPCDCCHCVAVLSLSLIVVVLCADPVCSHHFHSSSGSAALSGARRRIVIPRCGDVACCVLVSMFRRCGVPCWRITQLLAC